jgi:hypothetical protein
VGDGAAAAEFGSIVSVKSTNPEVCCFRSYLLRRCI